MLSKEELLENAGTHTRGKSEKAADMPVHTYHARGSWANREKTEYESGCRLKGLELKGAQGLTAFMSLSHG